MQAVVGLLMMVFSVLTPASQWVAPSAPVVVSVAAESPVRLVLTDFTGMEIAPVGEGPAVVEKSGEVDLRKIYEGVLDRTGTYVLYAVAKDAPAGDVSKFAGTPLVIEVRRDRREGAPEGPLVVRIEPLSYVEMTTDAGVIEMVFYYDVAPNTADNFLRLAREGYFDGLLFHRVVPGFVIQGGDPRGDGSGGPGYTIPAEFNRRPHVEGVLSMARQGDPNERAGAMPRREYADSAGSQFFICLDYAKTKNLDDRYTAFGQVSRGMDAVRQIAKAELAGQKPVKPQRIVKGVVKPVTADHNPYADLMRQLMIIEQKLSEPAK